MNVSLNESWLQNIYEIIVEHTIGGGFDEL